MSDARLTFLQQLADESGDGADGETLQWAADEIGRLRNEVSFERTFRISAEKSVAELRKDRERLDYAERNGLGSRKVIDVLMALDKDAGGKND
jgi:aminoglycoside phosphotransferase